jgi:hypothetical protein
MTGIQLVRQTGARVVIGSDNLFAWRAGVVVLTEQVARSSNAAALVVAAHEAAHAQQPRVLFWLRWLQPVRDHLEADAWRRAVAILEASEL